MHVVRLLADNGMVLVLLVLCLVFSILTFKERATSRGKPPRRAGSLRAS